MFARNTLGEVAQMQENGVPITFAYISDAHDNHGNSGDIHVAYGPGEAGYVQQLRDYDKAFGDFFARLKADGITKDNTLFAITVEEGDHFSGTAPDNPAATGFSRLHVQRAGSRGQRGERRPQATRRDLQRRQRHDRHDELLRPQRYGAERLHQQDRNRSSGRGERARLEKVMSDMHVTNPLHGTFDKLFVAMADPVERRRCTWSRPIPARTPTFTPFRSGRLLPERVVDDALRGEQPRQLRLRPAGESLLDLRVEPRRHPA
jgi:hypothetical protein